MHNDLPLAPESLKVNKVPKLIPNLSRRVSKGGAFGACAPPLEPNAQRKNLRRLKDLRGPNHRKSLKFSKCVFFFFAKDILLSLLFNLE